MPYHVPMTADQPVDDMAELVEERPHLVVGHQAGIVGPPARHSRHQNGLGHVLVPRALAGPWQV